MCVCAILLTRTRACTHTHTHINAQTRTIIRTGVTPGYVDNEAATAKAFRAGDGWFDTGKKRESSDADGDRW
jgi:long-subunit acyl-CoA synthetase (AMP-forming)